MYATVVRTYPITEITPAIISVPFGRKINRKGETQLVNHKDTNTIVTRLGVTSSWYRRWSETARSLSNAMTITFRKDATARRYWKYKSRIKTVGQKKAKSSPLDAIFNITALIMAVISCGNNPTARSEKARLRNSFLTVAGIVEFFIKVRMESPRGKIQSLKHRNQGRNFSCGKPV